MREKTTPFAPKEPQTLVPQLRAAHLCQHKEKKTTVMELNVETETIGCKQRRQTHTHLCLLFPKGVYLVCLLKHFLWVCHVCRQHVRRTQATSGKRSRENVDYSSANMWFLKLISFVDLVVKVPQSHRLVKQYIHIPQLYHNHKPSVHKGIS